MSRDSSINTVTGYGPDARDSTPIRRKSYFLYNNQIVFEAHPVSYAMGTGGSFPGV
jgi:hypothetical protein